MEVVLVTLGAVLALVSGLVTELWNERRQARAAARIILGELTFHGGRLDLVASLDAAGAQYGMVFKSTDWAEHRAELLRGAPAARGEPIAAWYGLLDVLGGQLGHTTGPPREELRSMLAAALVSARRLAGYRGRRPAQLVEGVAPAET